MSDTERKIIPKTIHYCWFGGKEMSPLAKACMKSWKQHMPDWKYVLWNEDNLPEELIIAKKLLEKKLYAFVSDYVRLYAIGKQGGIYLDTDIEVIRPLDPLLNNYQFLGFERQGRATSGVCGGAAGATFFQACLKGMDGHYARSNTLLLSPEFCMQIIEKHSFPDLKIYPPHVFYPYNPYDSTRPVQQFMVADIQPDTLTVHHWAKSWRISLLTKVRRKLGRMMKNLFSGIGTHKGR